HPARSYPTAHALSEIGEAIRLIERDHLRRIEPRITRARVRPRFVRSDKMNDTGRKLARQVDTGSKLPIPDRRQLAPPASHHRIGGALIDQAAQIPARRNIISDTLADALDRESGTIDENDPGVEVGSVRRETEFRFVLGEMLTWPAQDLPRVAHGPERVAFEVEVEQSGYPPLADPHVAIEIKQLFIGGVNQ